MTASSNTERTPLFPIRPLRFQGRPFFVVGTYDRPVENDENYEEDLEEWLKAGCNTVCVRVECPPNADQMTPEELEGKLRDNLKNKQAWATKHRVAVVYVPVRKREVWNENEPESKRPRWDLFSTTADGFTTIPCGAERAKLIKFLEATRNATAGHSQTLGYKTFDEPENHLGKGYKAYKKYKEEQVEVALPRHEWMVRGLKWTYDTLHDGNPGAYVMPLIAWETMYQRLAPLYDVNMPNKYPTYREHADLEGPLFEVVRDAAMAAKAVRVEERTSFVYTPGIFGNLREPWRPASLQELLYLCMAPLTQGAMGVFGWRLRQGLCSVKHRRSVVYPAMREVTGLVPWLLGDWCDEKVSSNHDTTTPPPYLNPPNPKAPDLPKLPVCSYILRRRPSNGYLLLAVNNLRGPLNVTFTLDDIAGLPDQAHDLLHHRTVPIRQDQITDTLEAFGVRAYMIEAG